MKKSALERIKANAKNQSNKNILQSNINEDILELDIDSIQTNPFQPRKKFDEESILELANSIKESGLIQPISVAKNKEKTILIAGERRLRAHKILGLSKIKANILFNVNDSKLKELSLIENIQRDNLSLIEEAIAYNELKKDGFSLRDIEKKTGKSKTRVGELLKLLNFEEECIEYILENKLNTLTTLLNIVKLPLKDHKKLLIKLKNNNLTLSQSERLLEKINNQEKNSMIEEKTYPFDLPEILGVDIKQSRNKLNISINLKEFNINDDIMISRHVKSIINKLKENDLN